MADEEKDETTTEEPEAVAAEPEPEAEADTPEAEAEVPAAEAEADAPAEAEPVEAESAETEAAGEPAAVEPPAKTKSRRHVPRRLRRQRPRPVREAAATRKPIAQTPPAEGERGRRQERRGVVVSDKGDKTIVVKVDVMKIHPKYKKVVRRSVKFHAHDEANTAGVGDTVRIVETRPLSKTKRWRLAEIVEKAR